MQINKHKLAVKFLILAMLIGSLIFFSSSFAANLLFRGDKRNERLLSVNAQRIPAQPPIQDEDPTTVNARVKKAKSKGASAIKLPTTVGYYSEINGLDDALTQFDVVLAQPVEEKSYLLDPRGITSFIKFRVIESLSRVSKRDAQPCCIPENVPNDLPPVHPGEIYVAQTGGRVVVDGVEVTQEPSVEFDKSQTYLLFLQQDELRGIGSLSLGRQGIFSLTSGDELVSLSDKMQPLRRDLENLHGKSLNALRGYLKDHGNP